MMKMNMNALPKKFSKYQREAIQMVAGLAGSTPFYYEKQPNNHLKILIDGVKKPLFTGCTPSDNKSIKNFRSDVRRALNKASQPQEVLCALDLTEEPSVEAYQDEKLILAVVKDLRASLEINKQKELGLVMQQGSIEAVKAHRKLLVEKAVESFITHKNRVKILKRSTKKKLQNEFNKHINFMLPTMRYYSEQIASKELKVIQEEIETVKPLLENASKKAIVSMPPKADKVRSTPETIFNVNALMSLSQYDRIDHLKSLSASVASQLIDNIQQAMLLTKQECIADVVQLMHLNGISLSDIKAQCHS